MEGAFIFAESIVPALDWAYSTTNSAVLKPFYAAGCGGCAKSLAIYDDTTRARQHFRGGHLTMRKVAQARVFPTGKHPDYAFNVKVGEAQLEALDDRSLRLVYSYPAEDAALQYGLDWTEDGWKVGYIAHVTDF